MLAAAPATADEPLRRGLGPEPDSLDIHRAQGLSAINLLRDLREGLVTYDAAGEPAPGVAESWSVSDDGLTWRFRLRADARWSNGEAVTAEDFVRAWRAALDPATASTLASLLLPVEGAAAVLAGQRPPGSLGIEAPGPRELTVRLGQPTPWFAEVLAHPVAYPLHEVAGDGPADAPVNGAYRIAEWVPQAMIRLERNPHFHGADGVAIGAVEYLPIEDPAAELARYRAGELHVTETIPPGRYAWLRENLGPDLRVAPYLGTFWLGLNLGRQPFSDAPALRRALALAIDRETLVRVVLGAGEAPAAAIVPPGLAGYAPAVDRALLADEETRLAEARRLYAEAGYGEGRPLRVELRYNTSSQHRRVAIAVAAMWKQSLGVLTELVNEEWKVFVGNRRMGVVTQAFRGGWIADYADPVSFLDLFRSGDATAGTFYANPAYDRLLDAAAARGGAERMALLAEAERVLMGDMPAIPLYHYVSRHLVRPGLGGWQDNVRDIHLSRWLTWDETQP